MENSSCVSTVRRPAAAAACMIGQDNGLASIADSSAEVGFSGNPISPPKRMSFRSVSSFNNNTSAARLYEAATSPRFEEPHFLESCFLCKKRIGNNKDIFMYRGDTPFCSEECRQEQIETDEAKEKSWNLSSSMKAIIRKDQQKSATNKSRNYGVRTSTVTAA